MSHDTTSESPAPESAPKVPPEQVALRAKPQPVTRLNRRTMMILAGGLAVAVLGATMWSLRTPDYLKAGKAKELYHVDHVHTTEDLDQLPASYGDLPAHSPKPVPKLGPPLPGDLGPAIVKSKQPVVARYTATGGVRSDRGRTPAEAAASSPLFFRSSSHHGAESASATPSSSAAPTLPAAYNPLVAGGVPTMSKPTDPTVVQNQQAQKAAFQKGGSVQTRNSGMLQPPGSQYEVMAGTVISAALVTGIKSDLPGEVIATVTEPVYDTATGKYLLIPQGSRILGKYNSQVSYGQSRVQVVWSRIILPDTSSLTLDNLAGTDPAGYAGLEDGVDWHWKRLVAGAAMTTLLGVGAELAAPQNQDGNHVIIAGRNSLQDSVNQVGQQMTRRNLNIQPTLTERPGLPVRIIVDRDLVLRPYQPLFVNGGAPP